jgi:hypothetical protein
MHNGLLANVITFLTWSCDTPAVQKKAGIRIAIMQKSMKRKLWEMKQFA